MVYEIWCSWCGKKMGTKEGEESKFALALKNKGLPIVSNSICPKLLSKDFCFFYFINHSLRTNVYQAFELKIRTFTISLPINGTGPAIQFFGVNTNLNVSLVSCWSEAGLRMGSSPN